MRSDSLIGYRLEISITYSNVALKRVDGELFPSRQLKKKVYIPYPKEIGVLRHSALYVFHDVAFPPVPALCCKKTIIDWLINQNID